MVQGSPRTLRRGKTVAVLAVAPRTLRRGKTVAVLAVAVVLLSMKLTTEPTLSKDKATN